MMTAKELKTGYWEWDVEAIEINPDNPTEFECLDHDHQDSFAGCVPFIGNPCFAVVLVWTWFSLRDGTRSWAYLQEDGSLPEFTSDSGGDPDRKVPKRFHEEVSRATKAKS